MSSRNPWTGLAVSIVGGHDSANLIRMNQSELVVRINHHFKRQGGRCGIVFTCGMESPESSPDTRAIAAPANCKRLGEYERFTEMKGIKLLEWLPLRYMKPNPYGPEYEFMNRFNHTIGTMPFTGIAAINYFLHLPVRSIFITGMTLYLDGGHEIRRTADGREQRWRDSHWIDPQVRWLKHLLTIDPRVTVDERLEELLARENCINGYTQSQV